MIDYYAPEAMKDKKKNVILKSFLLVPLVSTQRLQEEINDMRPMWGDLLAFVGEQSRHGSI